MLIEVLSTYAHQGANFLNACCIYPTAAFITPADIKKGYEALQVGGLDVVMPVAAFSNPIWRSLIRDENGKVTLNFPEHAMSRSQDLPTTFYDAGQWYWFKTEAFMRCGTLLGDKTGSVLLPEMKVQDIDTEDDWQLAEIKHRQLFDDNSFS